MRCAIASRNAILALAMTAETDVADERALARDPPATIASWWGLFVLVAIGLYMFMDRNVLGLQMEDIRKQLAMSDFQVGMVQGLSIAIFAAIIGYPVAWLSDRIGRRAVLAGSILVWSAAVAACGLAQNFEQMFAASAIVGAGESGLLPITYALVPELFRGRQKIVANSLMIVGGRIGSGIVIAACGLLIASMDTLRPWLPEGLQAMESWRLALLATAVPGPLFALLVFSLKLESSAAIPAHAGEKRPIVQPVLPFLKPNFATFAFFYLGLGMFIFGLSAIGGFLPVAAVREFGAKPADVGVAMGGATIVTMLIGFALVMSGVRALTARVGAAAAIWVMLFSAVGALATTVFVPFVQTFQQLMLVFTAQMAFVVAGTMVFPTALQDMTPAPLRARLVSIIITVNIVLSALSQPAVGLVSDQIKGLDNGLRIAMAGVGTSAFVVSVVCLFFCALSYRRTEKAARAFEAAAT